MHQQKICNNSCFTKLLTHFSLFDILLHGLKYSEPYIFALWLLTLEQNTL